jgi:hypothetical protein
MQGLPAAAQRQQLLAQLDQGGQGAVQVAVLVEKVPALRTQPAEAAADAADCVSGRRSLR